MRFRLFLSPRRPIHPSPRGSPVRHAPPGSELTVDLRSDAHHTALTISDHGPGIPEPEAERMKRPFTRLDAARSNATGTGLGLAIVDRIARLHDGRLELLPNPGGGLLARLIIAYRP